MRDLVAKYGRVFGMFAGGTPEFVVADELFLREILIKKFDSFSAHIQYETGNKYIDRNMTILPGDQWRRVRKAMSPTFTSARLKLMAPDINSCCRQFVKVLEAECESGPKEINLKESGANFTMDIIGRTTFGLQTNTQVDPDNEFVQNGRLLQPPVTLDSRAIAYMIAVMFPRFINYFVKVGIDIVPKQCSDFFCGIVDKLVDARDKEIEDRTDFIAVMVKAYRNQRELSKNSPKENVPVGIDKADIVASGFLLFVAGSDTVSSGVSACIFHLANNPHWQEKVYEEIQTYFTDADFENDIEFDRLKDLTLMEMCVDESLRLSPSKPLNDRLVEEDTEIRGILFKKGTHIWIPVWAIHHDPEYFPDPEKFDPMRFTPEAKEARAHQATYQAFGIGPRDCVGKRMALIELKMALLYLVRKFKFSVVHDGKCKMNFQGLNLYSVYAKVEKRLSA